MSKKKHYKLYYHDLNKDRKVFSIEATGGKDFEKAVKIFRSEITPYNNEVVQVVDLETNKPTASMRTLANYVLRNYDKPKLKMTFSHTLEIDFDVLPADMKAEYRQAKKVYDDCGDTLELETFYEELQTYVNEGNYKNFDDLELINSLDYEVSEEGVKV